MIGIYFRSSVRSKSCHWYTTSASISKYRISFWQLLRAQISMIEIANTTFVDINKQQIIHRGNIADGTIIKKYILKTIWQFTSNKHKWCRFFTSQYNTPYILEQQLRKLRTDLAPSPSTTLVEHGEGEIWQLIKPPTDIRVRIFF